jgi:ABC-2 type transport system permease protein
LYLTWTQILNVRTGWVWYFLLSSFIPLLTLFFLFMVLGYQIKWANYVVTGNVVFAVVLGSLNTLAEQMGWMKQNRFFEHYAALPVSKMSLITALVIRCTLFSFPSMVAVLLIGKLLFRLPIVVHPVMVLVFTLSGFALSGIGAFIGITSTNSNRANITVRVVFPVLVFTAPVLIPLENLPVVLRYTSVIMPTTYIADAFRAALVGDLGSGFWLSMGIILLYTVVSLYVVARKFDWRVD